MVSQGRVFFNYTSVRSVIGGLKKIVGKLDIAWPGALLACPEVRPRPAVCADRSRAAAAREMRLPAARPRPTMRAWLGSIRPAMTQAPASRSPWRACAQAVVQVFRHGISRLGWRFAAPGRATAAMPAVWAFVPNAFFTMDDQSEVALWSRAQRAVWSSRRNTTLDGAGS